MVVCLNLVSHVGLFSDVKQLSDKWQIAATPCIEEEVQLSLNILK